MVTAQSALCSLVNFEKSVDGSPINAEDLGGACLIAISLSEDQLRISTFELGEWGTILDQSTEGSLSGGRVGWWQRALDDPWWKVVAGNQVIGADSCGMSNGIL
jgi:hypothetical protein